MIIQEKAIAQLERISRNLATIGEKEDYTDIAIQALEQTEWIPFTTRPLTEEEKEGHSEWDDILDCELPDDGQRILVSISVRGHECVQYDEFYMDDGCYLDSGYEIGTEAVAWMPLPERYKAETESEE